MSTKGAAGESKSFLVLFFQKRTASFLTAVPE
jgi:hypothetical protein